jgi:two-component system sensor histidine kinase UhpB
MRLKLKHQILLAPATVLLLMTLLLGFLQYTYWDLSVKRQEAVKLKNVFIALAEADLAAQRMAGLVRQVSQGPLVNISELDAMQALYPHLTKPIARIEHDLPLSDSTHALLHQAIANLNPDQGFNADQFLSALSLLRPQLIAISRTIQERGQKLSRVHYQNIDALVSRTAMVSLIVLGATILLGTFLALFFARRLLGRIQFLSDSAGRIARGDLRPPPEPAKVQDELDDLGLSINRMTERLIRVVGAEKLLEGAEEERRRVAMDLHDQTLSDLSSVLRGIQGLKDRVTDTDEVTQLEEDLQRTMTNLREIMDNLHPQTLEILGLGAALESHLESYLDSDDLPEYHLYISPEAETVDMPRLARLTLYRIATEAIHNVIKHARGTRYEVNLARRGTNLVLSVEDNGMGFDPEKLPPTGGRGLNNIRERAHAIGAKVRWEASRFSSGTRFELLLPLNGDAAKR